MWKRIIMGIVACSVAILVINQQETLMTLANQALNKLNQQTVVEQRAPMKILEIQQQARFSLIIESENKQMNQRDETVTLIRETEKRSYPSQNSAEVHQYTWEQFQAKQLSFLDFDAVILGESDQDVALTKIQLEQLEKFHTLNRPMIIQCEQSEQTNVAMTNKEVEKPTLEKLVALISEKPKNKPTLKVVGMPQSLIGGKAQNIQFHVISFDTDEDKLDLSVNISGSSNIIAKQERKNLNSGAVEKFEFTEVQTQKNQPIVVSIEVTDQTGEQTKAEYTISTQASGVITETLTPVPHSEGYLLGDTLTLLRDVKIDFGNQGKKICEIESQLQIDGNNFGATIGPINVDGVNPADINVYLKENGFGEYTLELPTELNKSGTIVITSKVTLQVAKGNTCEKGKNNLEIGSGTSIIQIKQGQITTEFRDNETNQLLTQPYELKLGDQTFLNQTGTIIHEAMKTGLVTANLFDLTIQNTIPLKWSNHIKTEIINEDGSIAGETGTELNYSNSAVTLRYYFGPKNPLDGKVIAGLDNNQFELGEETEVIAANQSFLTVGAQFTLQAKPDQIVITNGHETIKPVLYYKTDLGYSPVSGIEWQYDSTNKQWLGTPIAVWNETMPAIDWQPPTEEMTQPCFVRWSVQMSESTDSTTIHVEPVISSDNQATIKLQSYTDEANLGSPTLPDLF